jgi:hypothetical protein
MVPSLEKMMKITIWMFLTWPQTWIDQLKNMLTKDCSYFNNTKWKCFQKWWGKHQYMSPSTSFLTSQIMNVVGLIKCWNQESSNKNLKVLLNEMKLYIYIYIYIWSMKCYFQRLSCKFLVDNVHFYLFLFLKIVI